jgi:hypothetical protein
MATLATTPQYTSTTRLARVKELWAVDKANREEIGQLLYEERSERLSVGGAGNRTGFHQWLRDAGIPKQSAYRRMAEYEISIGVRAPEDDYDKPAEPVPTGTSSPIAPVHLCPKVTPEVSISGSRRWTPTDEKRKNRSEPLGDFSAYKALFSEMVDVGFKAMLADGGNASHLHAVKAWGKEKLEL